MHQIVLRFAIGVYLIMKNFSPSGKDYRVGHAAPAASMLQAIGNTPLIRLREASAETGCDIYAKAEFMNPGGSVKDRAALAILTDAFARGVLKKVVQSSRVRQVIQALASRWLHKPWGVKPSS